MACIDFDAAKLALASGGMDTEDLLGFMTRVSVAVKGATANSQYTLYRANRGQSPQVYTGSAVVDSRGSIVSAHTSMATDPRC